MIERDSFKRDSLVAATRYYNTYSVIFLLVATLYRRIKTSVARKSRRFILREVRLKMDGVAIEPSLSRLLLFVDTSSNEIHTRENSDTRSKINRKGGTMRVYKNNTSFKI